ncbi:helix-turn-helix transcriptional regulator [Actinosynnema pretiosum subsp. pretiosum]|uniref:Helix-turn-helix transcriptional regulator n=1 Tax=Actinosynnema pretiosum subsp. pretiosum TaxID=103721 RepID=A0AA45L806_9PSEU|nr:helix-turn-helix transcriptional regulator [Actinosynnema pretiosum subsp. pretiosum]
MKVATPAGTVSAPTADTPGRHGGVDRGGQRRRVVHVAHDRLRAGHHRVRPAHQRPERDPDLADVPLVKALSALSALGDPVLLAVVRELGDGREHQGARFDVPVSQSTLSHHFTILRNAGVVRVRPEGARCWHSLRPEFEDRFPGLLATVLALHWKGAPPPGEAPPRERRTAGQPATTPPANAPARHWSTAGVR